ncbi:hypothetical protein EV421DRAFT_1900969 [Armillaria borealis]|uniref:Fungal-type protein kinase domain-containing protein n=1 Tax=Armillaria borealis TaxID=47425 RepID=A0AA39JSB7_9AGAR|nr:hypothetical protein EV421DRAFT_1900969 [Armillaria borealis]
MFPQAVLLLLYRMAITVADGFATCWEPLCPIPNPKDADVDHQSDEKLLKLCQSIPVEHWASSGKPVRLTPDVVAKLVPHRLKGWPSEALAQELVHKQSSIPVSAIRGVVHLNDHGSIIIMDHIPGSTLLRSIQHPRAHIPGPLVEGEQAGRCFTSRIFGPMKPTQGPFPTATDLSHFFNHAMNEAALTRLCSHQGPLPDDGTLVFSHVDLALRNVIMGKDGTPLLQQRPPSPIVIHSSLKPLRRKVKSKEDEMAELASAFKRQRQSVPATNVASDVFGSRSKHREDIPRNDEDSRSEGSESNSAEGFSDMKEKEMHQETLSSDHVDVPAMRRANEQRNWALFNVPAGPTMGGGVNRDPYGESANCHAPPVLPSRTPACSNSPRAPDEHFTAVYGPAQQGSIVTSSLSGGPAGMRDFINLYISLEGTDGEEHPHIEYDISVLRASIGEALTQILAKGGRTAQALKQMDHSQFMVSTSTHPLCHRDGGGDNLSFREIAALDQVLSQESSHYNTPLHSCRECTETLMVVQETKLSRSNLFVIYVHKTSSDMAVPTASGATLASAPVDAAVWQTWDRTFLPTIHSLSLLFDQSYNEPFKIYLAVHLVMAIAEQITSDKKGIHMGADRQLPGILDWLSARVGTHELNIFIAAELSQAEKDGERSPTLQMIFTWQNVPLRADTLDSEPLTPQELHHIAHPLSFNAADEMFKELSNQGKKRKDVAKNVAQPPVMSLDNPSTRIVMSSSMQTVIDNVRQRPNMLPSSIGRFQGRPSILDDILPNFSFTLHPSHSKQEACLYRSLVEGLTSVLWTYVLISGHPDASWGQAVTYPLGVGVVELTSLRYEMLYAAAFPHNNPDPNSKIQFFCKVWSTPLPHDVRRVVFLPPIDDWTGSCIINIDYELSDVLEFMGKLTTDELSEFLMAMEDFGRTDYSDFKEIHLSHNWFHAEVLSAINRSVSGLLEGELLDEAEILLGEGGDSKANSSA